MISHEHKFVFVHIPKCGGSSIESFFGVNPLEYSLENFTGQKSNNFFLQHAKILEIHQLSQTNIKKYFKFGFCRNPWDRFVSSFFYEQRFFDMGDFRSFVLRPKFKNKQHSHPQVDFVFNSSGELALDFVGKFENLQKDFNVVCKKLNLPQEKLPHKKKSNRKKYREYYTHETRDIIYERYQKDIEYFGYEF